MSKTEFCRLCANLLANTTKSQKLFERSQQKLLHQVEELTGLQLKNTKYLPKLICETCQEQTLQAHQFRELCIRVQEFFVTETKMITKSKESHKLRRRREDCDTSTKNTEIKADNDGGAPKLELTEEVVLLNAEDELINEDEANCADDDDEVNYLDEKELDIKMEIDLVADDNAKTKTLRKGKPKANSNLICDQCGRHFKCRSNFVIHMRRHAGDKPFQCELCPEKFNANWDLKRHIRNHTGELPYPCRYCERRFREISSRVRHERNHTNVRPFQCNQCEKSFTQSQYLKNHMLTHTGERAFDCKMCNVSFKRKTHLVTHFRSIMHKQNEEKHQSLDSQTKLPDGY